MVWNSGPLDYNDGLFRLVHLKQSIVSAHAKQEPQERERRDGAHDDDDEKHVVPILNVILDVHVESILKILM